MGTVCLQCGDKGFTNASVYCIKCADVFVHRYCLDVIPETFDEFVRWVCDNCYQPAIHETNPILAKARDCTVQEDVAGPSGVGLEKNDIQKEDDTDKNDPKQARRSCMKVESSESSGDCSLMQYVKENKKKKRSSMETYEERVKVDTIEEARLATDSTLPIEVKENKDSDQRGEKRDSSKPLNSDANPGPAGQLITLCNGASKSSKNKKTIGTFENKKKKRSSTDEDREKVDTIEEARLATDSTLPIVVKENKGSDQRDEKHDSSKPLDPDPNPPSVEQLITPCNGASKSSKDKKTIGSFGNKKKKRSSTESYEEHAKVDTIEGARLATDSTLPIEVKNQRDEKHDSSEPLNSDASARPAGQLITPCNGASKCSTKKKTVGSSEAKALSLCNQPELSTEERESEGRDEMTAATTHHTSNLSKDFQKDSSISSAEPVIAPVWRGSFNIWNEKHDILDGLVAHMSNRACQRVYDAACQFQPVLYLEMLPKTNVWPKSFQTSEPSGDNIALYFFPSETSEQGFDRLVDDMMRKELALKASLANAELLIFTSVELPLLYWSKFEKRALPSLLTCMNLPVQFRNYIYFPRFQGKYYLWGVFRGKHSTPSDSLSLAVELENKTAIHTDLPKNTSSQGAKNPATKKRCGNRSPLSPLSNSPSFGSNTF